MEHSVSNKRSRGLGIKNLDIQNQCLLSKWLFKLINEDGLWQKLLKRKYIKYKPIGQVQKRPGDSHFWSGLMKVKDKFLNLGSFQLNNGENISFWKDKWLDNFTLSQQYPSLYNIARKKHIFIATFFNSIPLNIYFRCGLVGNNLISWYNLVARIAQVRLNERGDVYKWGLR